MTQTVTELLNRRLHSFAVFNGKPRYIFLTHDDRNALIHESRPETGLDYPVPGPTRYRGVRLVVDDEEQSRVAGESRYGDFIEIQLR